MFRLTAEIKIFTDLTSIKSVFKMKKIVKVFWFYLQIDCFFLNEKEAILHYCSKSAIFRADVGRRYEHYFSIHNGRGELIGSLVYQFGEWVCFIGDLQSTDGINGIKSLRQLKKFVRKYAKI
jgi:hypothetical protein